MDAASLIVPCDGKDCNAMLHEPCMLGSGSAMCPICLSIGNVAESSYDGESEEEDYKSDRST